LHGGLTGAAVLLDAVTVRYGRTVAVEEVGLSLREGELVALVGPNGAGKSSLLRAVVGLVPHSGRVVVDRRRPRAVAFVPQRLDVELDFPITAAQVVATGRRAVTTAWRARRARERTIVGDLLARVGLAGLGGRPIGTLSGGQLQRLLVARALAQEPSVLLMDEPLAGLDPRAAAAMVDLFRDLSAAGATLLVATHDLALVRARFARAVAINRRLVGDGPPDEVLSAAGLERFFGLVASGGAIG